MENVGRLMMTAFGAVIFSAAILLSVTMYNMVNNLIQQSENGLSTRQILEVRQLE